MREDIIGPRYAVRPGDLKNAEKHAAELPAVPVPPDVVRKQWIRG